MSWRNIPVDQNNLEKSYTEKYGLNSRYQKEQKGVYADPKIYEDLKTAVSWLTLNPHMTVLDIGVNNGYELELFQNSSQEKWPENIKILGFDIIGEVLQKAKERFDGKENYIFIKGNVVDFKGTNIANNSEIEILDQSVDVVIALTSLQSTSIVTDFEVFINKLIGKLKKSAQILVGTPNFHLDTDDNIVYGLVDANVQGIAPQIALNFSKKLIKILEENGFKHKQTGEIIIFDYFSREN